MESVQNKNLKYLLFNLIFNAVRNCELADHDLLLKLMIKSKTETSHNFSQKEI